MLMNVSGSKLSAMVVKLAISPRHELVVLQAWQVTLAVDSAPQHEQSAIPAPPSAPPSSEELKKMVTGAFPIPSWAWRLPELRLRRV